VGAQKKVVNRRIGKKRRELKKACAKCW